MLLVGCCTQHATRFMQHQVQRFSRLQGFVIERNTAEAVHEQLAAISDNTIYLDTFLREQHPHIIAADAEQEADLAIESITARCHVSLRPLRRRPQSSHRAVCTPQRDTGAGSKITQCADSTQMSG